MITRKSFEDGSFKVMTPSAIKIIEFLKENKENAYTPKEISEVVKVSQTSILQTIKKLSDQGYLEVNKPYVAYRERRASGKKVMRPEDKEIAEEVMEIEEDDKI